MLMLTLFLGAIVPAYPSIKVQAIRKELVQHSTKVIPELGGSIDVYQSSGY